MSGGVAYVLDEGNKLYRNLNKQLVNMESVDNKADREELHILSKILSPVIVYHFPEETSKELPGF